MRALLALITLLTATLTGLPAGTRASFGQGPPPSPPAPTPTPTASLTPTAGLTATPALTPSPTMTLMTTPTATPAGSSVPTQTPTPSPSPTFSPPPPSPTPSPRPTRTPTRVPPRPTVGPPAFGGGFSARGQLMLMRRQIQQAGSYHAHQYIVFIQPHGQRSTATIDSDTSLRKEQAFERSTSMTITNSRNATVSHFAAVQVGGWETTRQGLSGPWKCQKVGGIPGPPAFANLKPGSFVAARYSRLRPRKVGRVSIVPIVVRSRHVLDQGNQVITATLWLGDRTLPLAQESVYFTPPADRKRAREWATRYYSRWGERVNIRLPVRCR